MINHKIIFWGTPLFSLPSLQVLFDLGLVSAIVTQADKPAGRKLVPQSSVVKLWAQEHNLAVLEPAKLDDDFAKSLAQYLPATFVIVAYGKIIPQHILDLSSLPAINIHPSKLPELRGPSPIQTAILQGLTSTAVTLMQLDHKMDHGPILAQRAVDINPTESYLELSARLAKVGAQVLADNIVDYLAGKILGRPQDDTQATICKMIKKEDGLVDWSKSATEIHNQVRAFYPWPSVYTRLGNVDVKIIKSAVVSEQLKPGEIKITQDLIVGCGQQSLQILAIQPVGKKILTADEFIRGYRKNLV